MSTALLKRAQHKILSDKHRERAHKISQAQQVNQLSTLAGGALAALYDHKKGSEDGAEPAKLFGNKEGGGGVNANLAVGGAVMAAAMLFKFPGRGIAGSVAAGMASAGIYRQMMESFEKHS